MMKFNALQNRTSGIAFVEGSYLVFLSDVDGSRIRLSLTNLQISLRGSNSQHFYFYDQLNKGEEICIQDRQILELLVERNVPSAKIILGQAKTQNLKRGVSVGFPVAAILSLLIALPIVLSFLPVSWVVVFLSPDQEKKLGAWLFPLIRAQYQVVEDHPAQTKLRILLNQLKKANPELESLGIELFVSTSSQVNAFAAPGNYIVLNKGLIVSANSVEEVMGVLAHEVGHIERRHLFKSIVGGLGSLLGTAGIATVVGFDAALVIAKATNFLELKYSRDDELAADKRAVGFLSRSNISADGLITFFSRLVESESNISSAFEFASTHPTSAERVRILTKMLSQQPKITLTQLPVELEELKAAF